MAFQNHRVVAIIPAFNEEQSVAKVVSELKQLRESLDSSIYATAHVSGARLFDHIVVCDNGSTDATAELASKSGAQVVGEFRKGYGFACLRAMSFLDDLKLCPRDIVVFLDADYSVLSPEVFLLLDSLVAGNELVIGNRVAALQESDALSPHQRFGNVLASFLIRTFWNQPVNDLGPFRAIRYASLLKLDMQDQRFGWTVEMQVKAIQLGYSYAEVPVSTRKRIGKSKISGTLRGTVGAALGIFGKIFGLYLNQQTFRESVSRQRADARVQMP